MSIDVRLSPTLTVPGNSPVVLIGANGVGKTRFGTFLVSNFRYDRISALRGLSVATIPMWTPEDAKTNTEQLVNQSRHNTSDTIGDLPHLLAELKADEAVAATAYRNLAMLTDGKAGIPPTTRIDTLVRLWGLIFPGRTLNLDSYQPKARWTDTARQTSDYSISSMSDGERSALYLIARVLRATPGVVVVDEPEVHFHTLLARQFWDVMEAESKDKRFVYITHDLGFALSRRGRIGIVKSPTVVELLSEDAGIPNDLFEGILGAASFSVVANRIVFCEGTPDRSVDIAFYSAWFRAPHSVVVPVGSCDEVRRSYSTFKNTDVIKNANPLAIVERDYWPDDYLITLQSEGMHVLPAHEVEGLFCFKPVAQLVSSHLGVSDFDNRYAAFETQLQSHFTGISQNKLVLERAKRDVDVRLLGLPNRAKPNKDIAATRLDFVNTVDLTRAVPDVGALFDEHQRLVTSTLSSGWEKVLAVFPGKDCLNILVGKLGINKETYCNLINEAIIFSDSKKEHKLKQLGGELQGALSQYLPSRS